MEGFFCLFLEDIKLYLNKRQLKLKSSILLNTT